MSLQADADYRVVHLFYEVAFLDSRRRAGLKLSVEEEGRLDVLIAALGGDPGWVRRRFRRRRVALTAIVKNGKGSGVARAAILDMSPDGMRMEAALDVAAGDSVLVKIGRPGTDSVQHSFPCRVVRAERRGGLTQMALTLAGIPLEVRYGSYRSEPRVAPIQQIRKTG